MAATSSSGKRTSFAIVLGLLTAGMFILQPLGSTAGNLQKAGKIKWNFDKLEAGSLPPTLTIAETNGEKQTGELESGRRSDGGEQTKRAVARLDGEIEHVGNHLVIEFEDSTFPEGGKVGLWTKADAATKFDDIEFEKAAAEEDGSDSAKKDK